MKNTKSFKVVVFVFIISLYMSVSSCSNYKPMNEYISQEINTNISIDVILEKINDNLHKSKYTQLVFVITNTRNSNNEDLFVKKIIENISLIHPTLKYSIVETSIVQNLNNNNIILYFK